MFYRIIINEAPNITVGSECTVILYFKNLNGTYANDERLPHGNRQTFIVKEFPVVVDFPFPTDEEFVLDAIITTVVVESKGTSETGETVGKLAVSPNQIIVIEGICG